MDYGKILSRAWEITWRWKALWILGFLASLGNGLGGGSNFYSSNGNDLNRWINNTPIQGILPAILGILVAVACLALLIGIALWVISIIARGGLIAGVQQVEGEGSTGFLQAWRVGRSRFWTLFGIAILASIPVIVLVVIGVVVLAVMFASSGFAFDSSNAAGTIGIATSILCGGTFCCGMIILAIVLDQIRVYAERAAILEGLGWLDAFKRGWQVLKGNLGPTIIFWLIFLVIGLLIGAIVVAGIAALVLPLVAMFTNTEPGAWIVAPLCCGGLLAVIVGALISSVTQTFTSAMWTLAYREMTGLQGAASALAAPPAVEPAAE